MKKRLIRLLGVVAGMLILFFLNRTEVQASDGTEEAFSYIDEWISSYDMSGITEGMETLFPEIRVDADELFSLILHGKIGEALKLLGDQVKSSFSGEFEDLRQVFLSILVLGVVSALFSGISDMFVSKQIAQAGFYFLYLFLMVVLTRVFLVVSEVARTAVENIVLFIKLFIPTYFMAVGAAQGTATAVCYYQIMLVAAYLVESFLGAVLIPFVYSYVILVLLNGLWAEEKLTLLLDFIEKGIVLALKISMGMVTGFSLVQAVIIPAASRLKLSAMRKVISAIPGVGGVAEGVTELMVGSAVLLKNSMGVLLLILLLAACVTPILEIFMIGGTVKFGAAVAGIVSDKRIAACTDRVATGCFLLLRCVFTATALFIIVIAVVSYTLAY